MTRKKWRWVGVGLSLTYLGLYSVAATSAEPMGALFIDGINTFAVTVIEEITGTYNVGMIPFPVNVMLGVFEWFAIGAYLLPGIGKVLVKLWPRNSKPPQ